MNFAGISEPGVQLRLLVYAVYVRPFLIAHADGLSNGLCITMLKLCGSMLDQRIYAFAKIAKLTAFLVVWKGTVLQ